jgi:hypothetical protein
MPQPVVDVRSVFSWLIIKHGYSEAVRLCFAFSVVLVNLYSNTAVQRSIVVLPMRLKMSGLVLRAGTYLAGVQERVAILASELGSRLIFNLFSMPIC